MARKKKKKTVLDNELQLQSWRKLVQIFELDHVFSIPRMNVGKCCALFIFYLQKNHLISNISEGRRELTSCPKCFARDCSHLLLCPVSHTYCDFRKIPAAWQTRAKYTKRTKRKESLKERSVQHPTFYKYQQVNVFRKVQYSATHVHSDAFSSPTSAL